MFPKLAVLVLSLVLGACILLAARQMRIQAVHELAAARLRILEADARLWKLRARIADEVSPQHIEQMAAQLGRMQPLLFEDPDARRVADGGLIWKPVGDQPAALRPEPHR